MIPTDRKAVATATRINGWVVPNVASVEVRYDVHDVRKVILTLIPTGVV